MTKKILNVFTNQKFYGPIEFFLTVLTIGMVAPTYGDINLKDYFDTLKEQTKLIHKETRCLTY